MTVLDNRPCELARRIGVYTCASCPHTMFCPKSPVGGS
jgi:hypothetical protein